MPRVEPAADLAERLADIELPRVTRNGVDTVRFGDLWADRPAVVVHLRHFGCILCRHFAVELQAEHARMQRAGVELVAVGTGGRNYAAEFVSERDISYPVVCDKFLETHEIIGARSGPFVGILKPRNVVAAVRAVAAGQMQGKTGPHPFVFGAAHVFGTDGAVHFAWLNGDYRDNPGVRELLVAAQTAVAA